MRKLLALVLCMFPIVSMADTADVVANAEQVYEATRIVCSGISDEIAKVANAPT